MFATVAELLEAFDSLPKDEKQEFTTEVLRRALPFDSGPITDQELGQSSAALFDSLDVEENAS